MRKLVVLASVIALASAPAMAFTGSWDFDDWTSQGWTLHGASIAGNPVENNADNVPDPSNNSGSLFAPDTTYATFELPGPEDSFIFEADVAAGAAQINLLKSAGLGYRHTYDADTTIVKAGTAVDAWFEGKSSGPPKIGFRDVYTGNGSGGGDWLDSIGPANQGGSWNVLTTRLTIDYNYTYPGEIWIGATAVDYVYDGAEPAMKAYGPAATNDALGGAVEPVSMLRLGGEFSWSQAYFDNVSFVPEPASLGLIALGMPLLLRRRR
jgi:hypothetical protein